MGRVRKRKASAARKGMLAVFAGVLLLLAGVLLLRGLDAQRNMSVASDTALPATIPESEGGPEPEMAQTLEAEEQPVQAEYEPIPAQTGTPVTPEPVFATPAVSALPTQAVDNTEAAVQGKTVYTEETYQLVTDLVYTMRNQGEDGYAAIEELLDRLSAADPRLGTLWRGIMEYWQSVCGDFTVNIGVLPDGLPQDDSLCIVVLGFQLMYDGEMAPELIGRCETALASAQKYPNAYILVTGGGTAYGNREATEAGVMADWLIARGIAQERIIVENASLTTDQNASLSCRILAEQYPQVHSLAIVSSDYHIALGSMLFEEASLLYACENAVEEPYHVITHAGFATAGSPEYSNPWKFSGDIWVLADPTY